MLYLKAANPEDWEQEYQAVSGFPADENGFVNEYAGCSESEFKERVLPQMLRSAQGVGLPQGYVPQTYFFLWDGGQIVGLYKVRHYLNDALKNGAGHIGYSILSPHRGRGYASRGLALAIEELKKVLPEDEIYLSCHIDNPASLRVQEKNGAYIHHSDAQEHYTRIKIRK